MKQFFEIRGRIQEMFEKILPILEKILKFVAAIILFSQLNKLFGGSIEILSKGFVPVFFAIVSIFVNGATIGVLAIIYVTALMLGTSWVLALVTAVLGVFLLGTALYFNRKSAGMFWIVPLLSKLGMPYLAPLGCGMFGPITSVGGVAVGCFVSYYLKAIIGYLPNLADEESTVTALDVLNEQVLSNSAFYVFLIAMILMTVVVYVVSVLRVQWNKFYALVLGLVVEILVQFAGVLFFNTGVQMGSVMLGSLLTLLIGLFMAFLASDGNYNRIEKVKFEDDEYIYHVHAIPKTKIAKANKKVTNVTRNSSKMDLTSNLGAVVEVSAKSTRAKSSKGKSKSTKRK